MRALRAAFPDLHFFLEDLVAEGDLVAVRYHWTGTRTGRFLGLAPGGIHMLVRGMEFYRFSGGTMVEHWDSVDHLGLMQQPGILPELSGSTCGR